MSELVVLDASVFVAWVSPSQRTEAAMQLLADKDKHRFIVPSIFRIEVRNVLIKAERREKWRIAETEAALDVVDSLNLVVMPPLQGEALDEAFRMARADRLSMYDSLYLYEAVDHWAAVASRDEALLAAAERRGLGTINAGAATDR